MAKVSPIQGNFNGGEFSPLVQGRVDSERYNTGLDMCENWIPLIQGGLTRRPGTQFVSTYNIINGVSTDKIRLVPFEFSTTQAYMLEFGGGYIGVYKDRAPVISGGDPYVVTQQVSYSADEIPNLRFTQSADVLYSVSYLYAPAKLLRYADDDWRFQEIDLLDGPYLNANFTHQMRRSTAFTVTPSAATGSVTLTAGPSKAITGAIANPYVVPNPVHLTCVGHGYSTGDRVHVTGVGGTTEANGTWIISVYDEDHFTLLDSVFVNAYTAGGSSRPGLFETYDVGAKVRVLEGAVWGWGIVTAFTSSSVVTVQVKSTFGGVAAKSTWRMGLYRIGNYPTTVNFHEDRLFLGGPPSDPQRIDGSVSGDYENFQPTYLDGSTATNLSLGFTLNSNDVNSVRWMNSDEKGLLVGTVGGEWVVRPSTQGEALSSTNITAKRATSFGSAAVQAIQAGKSSIFIQRAGRKVRELTYFYDVDGFQAPDISILAEHMTKSGVTMLAMQKEPQSVVWMVREDGALIGMTYERTIDGLKVGFHRHFIGGASDAIGTNAMVESVAVIPNPEGTADDVWVSVKRHIDGAVTRHIEYITPLFDDETELKDAIFLDASLTYDVPKIITAITKASSAVVSSTSHGFSTNDKIIFSDIVGMTELNGNSYTITATTANTFTINVDSSGFTTYVSGGEARKKVSTISGLDHLEGETVSILGDGAVQTDKTVSSGAITLDSPAGTVQVGYNYNSDAKQLRLEAGAADGTSMGKTRRINRVAMLLHNTLGIKIGSSFDSLFRLVFRKGSDQAGASVPLFSGMYSEPVEFPYDLDNQFCIRADQPLPATILAIMPQLTTQDR